MGFAKMPPRERGYFADMWAGTSFCFALSKKQIPRCARDDGAGGYRKSNYVVKTYYFAPPLLDVGSFTAGAGSGLRGSISGRFAA